MGGTGVSGRETALVAGGGGFIGGHLARTLSERGVQVRSVDIKPLDEWYQIPEGVETRQLDLSALADCHEAVRGIDTVYNLAADMGGMGFIETHKAECMLSVLINTHLLMAARDANVDRFFFSSSACVYAADKQVNADVTALKESDAYPAMAGRRLRLGEVVQRAHVPALPRGLRPGDARRPLPQRLRRRRAPTTADARRPRLPSAARLRRLSSPAGTRSRSGATASRPAASCMSTTASRGH